jgi:hypothetical protein
MNRFFLVARSQILVEFIITTKIFSLIKSVDFCVAFSIQNDLKQADDLSHYKIQIKL